MRKCEREGCDQEATVVPELHVDNLSKPITIYSCYCGECSLLVTVEEFLNRPSIKALGKAMAGQSGRTDILDPKHTVLRFVSIDDDSVKRMTEAAGVLAQDPSGMSPERASYLAGSFLKMLPELPEEMQALARISMANMLVSFIAQEDKNVEEFAINIAFRLKGDTEIRTAQMMEMKNPTVGTATNAWAMLAAAAQHLGTLQIIRGVDEEFQRQTLSAFYSLILQNIEHLRDKAT